MQDNTLYTITGILVKVAQQKGGRGTWGNVCKNVVEPSVPTSTQFHVYMLCTQAFWEVYGSLIIWTRLLKLLSMVVNSNSATSPPGRSRVILKVSNPHCLGLANVLPILKLFGGSRGVISLKQKVLLSLREGRGIFEALEPGSKTKS